MVSFMPDTPLAIDANHPATSKEPVANPMAPVRTLPSSSTSITSTPSTAATNTAR